MSQSIENNLSEIKFLIRLQILKHKSEFLHIFKNQNSSQAQRAVFSMPPSARRQKSMQFDQNLNQTINFSPVKEEQSRPNRAILQVPSILSIDPEIDKTIQMFELATPSYLLQARNSANNFETNYGNLAERISQSAWNQIQYILQTEMHMEGLEIPLNRSPSLSTPQPQVHVLSTPRKVSPNQRQHAESRFLSTSSQSRGAFHMKANSIGKNSQIAISSYKPQKQLTRIASQQFIARLETENQLLKDKITESSVVIKQMRQKYFKQITNLRQISYQTGLGNRDFKQFLNVHFFDSTKDGLDERSVELLNSRLSITKKQFENILNDLRNRNQEMYQKVTMYQKLKPQAFQFLEMTIEQIFGEIAKIQRDPLIIWKGIESAYRKGFFNQVIENQMENILGAVGIDGNRLDTQLDKLREDHQQKWKSVRLQCEQELFVMRKEKKQLESRVKEVEDNLKVEVEKVLNSCFEHVNIEISDINKTLAKFDKIDIDAFNDHDKLLGFYKQLRSKYRLFRLEYMKMRERSEVVQEENQELNYKNQELNIKLQEREEKFRQIFHDNQALVKTQTELKQLTDVQKFQIEKLELHLNRAIPDYKRKKNARLGILMTKNNNSDSRTSTARALYQNKFINRDTITKVQGIDLEFIDQIEIEQQKLKLKEEKLEEEKKPTFQDVEVQTDEIQKEQMSQQTDDVREQGEKNESKHQMEQDKQSELPEQNMQSVPKTPSQTSLLTKKLNQSSTVRLLLEKSVQLTKNSSQHSFAQKSVNVGVQSYEVQIQTDSIVEQVDKLSISQLQNLIQMRKQQLNQGGTLDNPNNNLSQIQQHVSQEQVTVGHSMIQSANQSTDLNRAPSPIIQKKSIQPIQSPHSKTKNPSALSMHGLTTPSPGQTPSVINHKNQQQFRVDITPNSQSRVNQQQRYYEYEGSQDSQGHGQMSAKLESTARKSQKYYENKKKRRQTIAAAADANTSNSSWNVIQQRRETSDGVILHNVRSSKNLITPLSNNSRANLVLEDEQMEQNVNNEGMNLSAYQRALAYISAEKPKQKEFFELQKKQMQQKNYLIPAVYNRLYNDANTQQQRKKAFSNYIQRERAKELTQIYNYKTPRNNFPTASDQEEQILEGKIRGFFPIHNMLNASRQNSQHPIDSSYMLSNNGSLLNLSAQPSLNKLQQLFAQPDISGTKKKRNFSGISGNGSGYNSLQSTQRSFFNQQYFSQVKQPNNRKKINLNQTASSLIENNNDDEKGNSWTTLSPSKKNLPSLDLVRINKKKLQFADSKLNASSHKKRKSNQIFQVAIGPPASNLSNTRVANLSSNVRKGDRNVFSTSFKEHPFFYRKGGMKSNNSLASKVTTATLSRKNTKNSSALQLQQYEKLFQDDRN